MAFKNYDSSGNVLSRSLTDLPVGTIVSTALSAAPSGWLICDGAAVSRTNYPELFGALGTGYGAGDASTTFNVPNSDGQMILAISTAQRIGVAMPPQFVTTLPTSPIDGTEVYYQADATNGVIWHLRYRAASASAYKWEFVGGGDLSASVVTDQSLAAGSGWQDLATVGPSITAPLAGDYAYAARIDGYYSLDQKQSAFAVQVGSTTPTNLDSFYLTAAAATSASTISGVGKVTSVASGAAIKLIYSRDSTGTGNFRWRFLSITPIRVSA